MKLTVRVIEARDLLPMDSNGFSDPYVKLQLGKYRARTKVVRKSLNPSWEEEFSFLVGDLNEELILSVMDEDKFFADDFIGQVKIPVSDVFDAERNNLGAAWYELQNVSKKGKKKECGDIYLHLFLSQKGPSYDEISAVSSTTSFSDSSFSERSIEATPESGSFANSNGKQPLSLDEEMVDSSKEEKMNQPNLVHRFFQIFGGKEQDPKETNPVDLPELPVDPQPARESTSSDASSNLPFDELLKTLESKDQGDAMPDNLPGGILVDQPYVASPSALNSFLFSPDSSMLPSLAELQGTTGLQQLPWMLDQSGKMKREVTYIKAPTKLIKAVKATEEQTYLKADGRNYAVLSSVSTPDVPYGGCFRTEVLFCVTSGPDLPSEEPSSRLVISWRMNFSQSTMMKGMIENGARQGLKESFAQFQDLLSKNIKPVDLKDLGNDKDQVLASLKTEQESDWKLAVRFLGNFTVISTVFAGFYILAHILLTSPSILQGLEFVGLDLPDSIGEMVVSGIIVLQGERALKMIGRFLQARRQKGTDHGVRGQGDGWLLTVALIEGSNLATVDSSEFSDPYVVFTCNGRTKTSSIKFQTPDPQWNEIFEFDAMDDPPSVMELDVYDFDGPFDDAVALGHAEINFVKSNLSDLADIWVPLGGKLAQACQSKLHLRVFLNNTRGTEVVKDYLTKMEKELGKKINARSPQTNSAFQKLFNLPPEEFLINDFTCHLKRKMPLQGRLFLSPRIIGFHANLFGHKTKFFFLWEDIEDVQIVPPTLTSMGSPSLVITLRRGKGTDASHGAKIVDSEGRLKYHFQSFVSFHAANRTIMALWKARALTPEQKVQMVEEESESESCSESKGLQNEESGSFIGMEEAKMSEVFTSSISSSLDLLMELFSGGLLDRQVMEKVGCVDYTSTPWEAVKSGSEVYQRQTNYKFGKSVSSLGGEATSTQQKSLLPDKNGWVIEEVMTLQGIPFGDYFNLHLKYQVEDNPTSGKSKSCNVKVYMGIAWLKSTKHQKRISKNVVSNLADRLKVMFKLAEQYTQGK